ncbi:peroxisomal membrane protein PEX14-like [Lucilia sericata]|uniref:peroxisomal membrane protein PEX14-like n=1 Tax=Lucilia sericata TaxID=13632 RepID=UPI0018A82CD3|nr:peroxisomal membrane protein PEX14-like [Lucilia sericata]
MSTSNTDTGDTVNITTTELQQNMDNNVVNEGQLAIQMSQDEPAPREALITTAVNFLNNAKVRHTTLSQKQQFLRSKGLTSTEIQIACERAGVFSQDPNAPTVINMGINATQTHAQLALQQPKPTALQRLKEVLHSMALLGGVAYAIFMFWKKFLQTFLFGGKKKKSVDDALNEIDKKVDTRLAEVKTELTQVKESLAREQRDQTQQFMREFNQFKSDLEAIKGLLLNRKQFPSPLTATVGAPSIPAWQLSSSSPRRILRNSQSDDNEIANDTGSGSGSSETEVVTKNSDSSLEIM